MVRAVIHRDKAVDVAALMVKEAGGEGVEVLQMADAVVVEPLFMGTAALALVGLAMVDREGMGTPLTAAQALVGTALVAMVATKPREISD